MLLSNNLRLNSQDVSFSQFYSNPLYLNPSLAGVERDIRRIIINYRNQWPATGKTYRTYCASYDQYIEDLHGGVGFRFFNDIQGNGTLMQYAMSLDYSYHLQVTRELSLNAGFEASFVQRSIKTGGFIFEDMIDPSTGQVSIATSESYYSFNTAFPDFTVGFAGFYRNYYGGVSMAHLLKPYGSQSSDENSRIPRRITVFAGAFIPVYEKRLGKEVVQVNPNIIYQQQNSFSQLNYGVEGLIENQFVAGIWMRQNLGIRINSLIFSGGYVTRSFRIRYSYDRHLSAPDVNLPVLGAHEISLIVTLGNVKKIKHRAIKCPKI